MSDDVINTVLDTETIERLEAISDEITPEWLDRSASKAETIRYLARFYHGEIDE